MLGEIKEYSQRQLESERMLRYLLGEQEEGGGEMLTSYAEGIDKEIEELCLEISVAENNLTDENNKYNQLAEQLVASNNTLTRKQEEYKALGYYDQDVVSASQERCQIVLQENNERDVVISETEASIEKLEKEISDIQDKVKETEAILFQLRDYNEKQKSHLQSNESSKMIETKINEHYEKLLLKNQWLKSCGIAKDLRTSGKREM
ncbi:hypothetical protein AX774_g8063 [Zancudomyces culisetae]|uniref:Uncharacterized protein n=1 Tax=Zancudomyces culisetae TaxID=1213189 RepID=A0A1R1PC62_ZANCU|nr:hypothetical protein AX774_g8063 [Zancudomyces culisetae]|eukprot:OMH78544.1 hypothetical protein AX774_g8063 [Zancudomyces culisetae]